jgi:hypothetical protein
MQRTSIWSNRIPAAVTALHLSTIPALAADGVTRGSTQHALPAMDVLSTTG